jgi:aspartate kinase
VEFGRRYGVAIHVRSSFTDAPGTWIKDEENMEQAIVAGVSYALEDVKVTIYHVPDRPGVAARVFSLLADADVNIDMIIQNVSEGGKSDISFTVSEDDLAVVHGVLDPLRGELGFDEVATDSNMAKVSIVGAGMKTHPGVAATMFRVLADNQINIEMISTSSIKISCVIEKQHTERAVRALHAAFQLEKESIQRDEVFS